MRILGGVYEGPGSHGILRMAASMKDVHAVLRAYPEEWGFPALYGAWTRSGEPAPVSSSPVRERPGGGAAGDAGRDLDWISRRLAHHEEEVEALLFARSEAALLSGEGAPILALPANPVSGRPPKLITCEWESPEVREAEAADKALLELVSAYVQHRPKTPTPTVNLFGPPIFNPNAAAEADEMERLLNLLGVEVNARIPLGATVGDLKGLPRAWANVVLYRETAESALLYLQDEFGIPRVTTPPIGSAGTGAVLRAVGELCSLDEREVRRAAWAELAQTARLPWYARLERPEAFEGRRVALFGDLTYTTGLGYTLAHEVGLEVAWAGTYLTHLEKDFLLHAHAFTENAFVADDPGEVAARVEETAPDLLIGTHLEKEAAASLGIPFLPLCPPVAGPPPFVEKPLMGYAGSSTLADALDGVIEEPPAGARKSEDLGY